MQNETKRHQGVRVEEHLKGSHTLSAIGTHVKDCVGCQSSELDHRNFEILKSGTTKFDVTILEALLIKKHSPTLNVQLYSQGASFILRTFS